MQRLKTLLPMRHDDVALRCSQDHHKVLLYPAPGPGLKRAAFELGSERELDKARGHIA